MKNHIITACIALALLSCKDKDGTQGTASSIKAVKMPSKLVSGQSFPTDSTILNGWIDKSVIANNLETNGDIITHAWDIWAALTEKTDQKNNDQTLRRFETWFTPADIINALKEKSSNGEYNLEDLTRANHGLLKKQNQHLHGRLDVNDADVVGFVKYDPTAANHIYTNELYYFEVLKAMIKKGQITNIPAFPSSSVVIKPVFYPLTKGESLGPDTYSVPVWPGYNNQIPMDSVISSGFGTSKWNNNITITTTGKTDAANKIFSINDFIHFKLDKEQAANLLNVINNQQAKAGDYAVLVGMHVNTRENKRWTWQTFWWSEQPDTPHHPSSELIASFRPKELDNAAKHYAMGVAYNMISPTQPYTGGSNAVTKEEPMKQSVYAYNPYLEAGFDAGVFNSGNDSLRAYYSEGYQKVGATMVSENVYEGGKLNMVGIQTNCMSCHGQARIYDVPKKGDTEHYYITDQYFDMDAPYFKSTVVLDFVWSIQGNLINKKEKE